MMQREAAMQAAEREFGAIKHPLPVYWRGAVCWRILMLWPVSWFGILPNWVFACAGDYMHDARQYAIGMLESGKA